MIERTRLPAATLILIAVNLMAAFGVLTTPELIDQFGFNPSTPSGLTGFTCLFLHANLIHLLGNMVFLAAVGSSVELATGTFRFGSVYLLSGIVGVVTHYFITSRTVDLAIFVGASGCIAGCAGYYSFRYTGLRVSVLPGRTVSVATVTGVWVLLQIIGAFVRLGESAGTAFWAHMGGFVTGIALSVIFKSPDIGQAKMGHALMDSMTERGPGAVVTTARRHLKKHPRDPKALANLADAYNDLNDQNHEADTLRSLLSVLPESELPRIYRRLLDLGRIAEVPILKRLVAADKLKDSDRQLARDLLLSIVDSGETPQRPEALFSLVTLERERNPSESDRLLSTLSVEYPLHPAIDLARMRGWLR